MSNTSDPAPTTAAVSATTAATMEPPPATLAYERATYTSRDKWLVLTAAFLGWMFDGLEMGIFPQIARSALGELLARGASEFDIKWWHQVIDACFLFGAALGGLVFGWLGDRIGRVKAMAFSILVYSGFTGLLYFVRAPEHIAALRFIAAVGMGGEWALGVALVMEVWSAKYRPLLAGMIGAAANVGFLIVGAIGAVIKIDQSNWRYLALVGAAPALLTFLIRLFVPESHAWQAAQTARPTRPLTELFADKRLTRSALLAIVFASIALLGTWGAVQKIPAWVGDPNMPGRTATAQGYTQMALAIGAIAGCMIAPLVAAWLNRRITFFLLCLGSLVSCQMIFALNSYSTYFLVMAFVVGGMTAAVYGWLPLYLPELFPTRVRATAQGISFNFGRIFAGVGGIVLGGSVPGGYAKMGAVVSLIYVLGLVLIWLAPETKGKPLPE